MKFLRNGLHSARSAAPAANSEQVPADNGSQPVAVTEKPALAEWATVIMIYTTKDSTTATDHTPSSSLTVRPIPLATDSPPHCPRLDEN